MFVPSSGGNEYTDRATAEQDAAADGGRNPGFREFTVSQRGRRCCAGSLERVAVARSDKRLACRLSPSDKRDACRYGRAPRNQRGEWARRSTIRPLPPHGLLDLLQLLLQFG